jgi:hypothetical protein
MKLLTVLHYKVKIDFSSLKSLDRTSEELTILASFSILLHSTAPPPTQFQEGPGEWSILLYPGVLKTTNWNGFWCCDFLELPVARNHFLEIDSSNHERL